MASLRASIRNQNHARHGRLIPLQIRPQVTSDSEAGVPRSGSLLVQAIDCMFSGRAVLKVLFLANQIQRETDRDTDGVCFF